MKSRPSSNLACKQPTSGIPQLETDYKCVRLPIGLGMTAALRVRGQNDTV
jgi:hypothetical protein